MSDDLHFQRALTTSPWRITVLARTYKYSPIGLSQEACGGSSGRARTTVGQPGFSLLSGPSFIPTNRLLRQRLARAADPRYHRDFDWGGIRIANVLHDRVPFTPWRFDTASYLAAGEAGRPLTGTPVEARWDPVLTTTMHHAGRRIEEELVLDDLMGDLSG